MDEYKMYVIVGHPLNLSVVIEDNLKIEIQSGIQSLILILVSSVALLFIVFAWFFEKRLQSRVTKPIQDLTN